MMNINNYDSAELLIDSVTERIADCIRESIETHGDARILLSGGSTPGPVYEQLSHVDLDWSKVHVGLVDERFVEAASEYSNERLLNETLLQNKAKEAQLTGMVFTIADRNNNLDIAEEHYQKFIERTDYTLLGMGGDGHTASLFPNDENSEADLDQSSVGLINTQAPAHPENRISCSKALILNTGEIGLMIKGKTKLDVLCDTDRNLPIHRLMSERTTIETYYTE
ncbi:MAG: 6-phosphogluconolactonase [Crocinitomicaceae bacterium]